MKSKTASTTLKLQAQHVTVRLYPLIVRAVEEGCTRGLNRARKHHSDPDYEVVRDAIEEAVLTELCELFDFGDPS